MKMILEDVEEDEVLESSRTQPRRLNLSNLVQIFAFHFGQGIASVFSSKFESVQFTAKGKHVIRHKRSTRLLESKSEDN